MRILVLQHASVEHPGIFRDFFRADGFTWDTVELDLGEPIPALEPYDFMLVMGGPQDVWQEAVVGFPRWWATCQRHARPAAAGRCAHSCVLR